MEELLNNIFFQVFILTASIAGSFWYLKREQRKEDAGDAKKRIEGHKASALHTIDSVVEHAKDTAKAVSDLNTATLEVLKEHGQEPVLGVETQKEREQVTDLDVQLQKDQLASNLIQSLKNEPNRWFFRNGASALDGSCIIKHQNSGVEIWRGINSDYTSLYNPCHIEFNDTQKRAIFKAIEDLRKQRATNEAYDAAFKANSLIYNSQKRF